MPRWPQRTEAERFWSHVDKSGPCWLWTACTSRGGYGFFYPHGNFNISAHRYAYELTHGPIPDGLEIDHVKARGCTHRNCVNPAHLEAVTRKENILRSDCPMANHARQTHCIHGHEFTPENIYRRPGKPEGRVCRMCQRRNNREKQRRLRRARRLEVRT